MSILSEINRLKSAKAALKAAIQGKGVTVSSSASISTYGTLVDSIDLGYQPATSIKVYNSTGTTLLGSYTFDTPVVVSNINYQCPAAPPANKFTINGVYSFTASGTYGSGGYALSPNSTSAIIRKSYGANVNYSQSLSGNVILYETA